uniref:Cleavage and polyadenylation specificity factor subunit 2 n=1 Tax=Strigamia maritima TaxID=126957 RepID=T1J0U4_STRMM
MTSIIKLQPLSGVFDETPHCYICQVDEFRFLLDCGWDEKFNPHFMKEFKKHIHTIDAVLLSYPDYYHLGALPYAVGKLGLTCPIFATIPVYKMGQMFMYDLYQSRHNSEEFDLFTLDDVDAAFDKIIQLKYNQSVSLKGKGHGLTITPLMAGHMIGGTIWRIVKDGEEDIVYAVDYNHKKERHLNGCVLETISRPSLLITDAFNTNYNQSRRRQRDEQLMTNILQTLRNGGNVLVAVDTAGRVLELAHMVDQLWRNQDSGLLAYSLALLNNVSYNVVEFAKSQVEWMSDKIMRSFEGARSNPFQFKHLQLCHSLAELSRVPDPKVVLASSPDLECGFSRDLFLQWCSNPKNSVILTTRTCPGTLARYLIDNPATRTISLEIRKRVRLESTELEEYLRRGKEKEETTKKGDKNEVIDSSEESDDEMDVENQPVGKAKHDLMMKNEGKSRGGFFKQAKKSYPMFPFHEEKIRWDDYGEIIKPEDFLIMEFNPAEEETKDKTEEANEEIADISEVPTKCIRSQQMIDINCSVQFIDFEGRSDGESIRKIISSIKPRRLVVVRGSPDATMSLASYCGSAVQGKIFTPQLHECIDATTESHIYQVRLKDFLVSSLEFSRAKDAELAWVDGEIRIDEDETLVDIKPQNENSTPMEETDDDELKKDRRTNERIPTLEPLPINDISDHSTVFVNELKLSDFKQVLIRAGIHAEFSAGVLYCNNGLVAVRRNEAGRINLEGCLCEDYFRIRELLYEQYAIV